MKTQLLITAFLFLLISSSKAQLANPYLSDDTVTTGAFDDCHPALERGNATLGFTETQWLVFERRSDSASMIAAKRCLQPKGIWDTSVAIISTSPKNEDKQFPDISASRYFSGGKESTHSITAWQQQKNGIWNIYVSTQRTDSAAWDPPTTVTNDTINCTHPHLVAFNDSTYLLSWKRKSTVLYSQLTLPPSPALLRLSTPDTIAGSNDDSVEYDIMLTNWNRYVVSTARDSSNNRIFLLRQINVNPALSFATPETLSMSGNLSNPRFVRGFNYTTFFLYELAVNNRHEVHLADGYGDQNLSPDPTSDYRNPCAFMSLKVIGKAGQTSKKVASIMFDVLTMEENNNGDSLLFVQGDFNFFDSIRSAGYNRNASTGSFMYYLNNGYTTPIVWESNRDGRSHLYSRMIRLDLGGGVREKGSKINSFELHQNFPNPFNPSTTIRFRLFAVANVGLRIYDLLGRTVETLIDKKLTVGDYETKWDGSKYSSGVYFCRLEAGAYVVTKKLILLK